MFPKKGKSFPTNARNPGKELDYTSAIAAALRRELGDTHQAVKTVMRWTGANERTVKNWLAAKCGPNGDYLICLFRHSNAVLDVSLRLAGREEMVASAELAIAREALAGALMRIDSLISEKAHPR